MTTACLIAREDRRAGDRVRDVVEVSLEKEVDTIRTQQGKMRDYLVQVGRIILEWSGARVWPHLTLIG